jgi:polysaccharide biosynthesis transport protein
VSPDQFLGVLWQRRWLFAFTTALCLAAVVVVTLALPNRYDATATLFVGELESGNESLALDTGVGEQLARTYTALAAQPSVADEVVRELAGSMTREELLEAMTFAPVERTQLLQITARAGSPREASDLANRYAETFIGRVDASFQRSAAPTRISVTEPAVPPSKAASPNVPLYIGFGAILALVLGAALVLLRERLDDRLRVGADELEVLGQPIIARIPTFGEDHARSPATADAFRLLGANVDFAGEGRRRVLAITSSTPLEGKSTTAAHLALAAAQNGESVVLVEADLRRPGLRHTALGELGELGAPAPVGLTNYLAGTHELDAVVAEHSPGLSVVWPGPLPPNPTRLLGSDRLRTLVAELRLRFDRVIIDTSPISVGADASVVLGHADGVLFVVDVQRAGRSRVRAGLAQLETSRAALLGVVLNRSGRASRDAYGYYAAPNGEHGAVSGGKGIGRLRR